MTVLSVKIMTSNVLLSLLFISRALADCPEVNVALFITTPKKMEALSGSCLQIPCKFRADPEEGFDSKGPMFGVWIKSDVRFARYPQNVIFNSSQTVNTYPMEITGDLSQGDCTTLFSNLTTAYTDKYFFRIENGPFKATASCDPLWITIEDSPWSPRINISGELTEKESVTISCSAFDPCPHSLPQLTWNLQQDPHKHIQENPDGTFTIEIQQSITLSYKDDGLNISCSATYPVDEGKHGKTAETHETLNVTYAPKETSASISPPGLVSAGSYVNLTCSSRANPPVSSFTWFLKTKDGPKEVAEGHFHRFNVSGGGVYYCVATNTLGYQESAEIPLTVEGDQPGGSFRWEPVLGGIFGIILLICLIIFAWWFKSRHQTQQQSQTGEELVFEGPQRKAGEEEEENIHYGQIDFKQRREPSSDSVQDIQKQQDTVYAEVKVNKSASNLTQTDDAPEEIYAQVKKK